MRNRTKITRVATSQTGSAKARCCQNAINKRRLALEELKKNNREYLMSFAFVYSPKKGTFDSVPLAQYNVYKASGYDIIRFV